MSGPLIVNVCGWCGRFLGFANNTGILPAGEHDAKLLVSHGMCPSCSGSWKWKPDVVSPDVTPPRDNAVGG